METTDGSTSNRDEHHGKNGVSIVLCAKALPHLGQFGRLHIEHHQNAHRHKQKSRGKERIDATDNFIHRHQCSQYIVDENNTKIENNLSLIFNNWLNDCDVIEKIEEHVAIEGAGGTFMLAFGSNITNAPTEGLEWFIVLYKAARILAWRDDCLFTNARNGASDNYMGWKRYVSEDLMNNEINAIKNFIHKSVENYEDYWKLEMSATCSNTLEAFKASKPHRTVWIHDSITSVSMNMTDSYTAKCTTNVYVDSDKNLTFTVTTDDASSIFVNKTLIASLATCTATSVTLPLKQGWNEIIVIYTEGSGADGWLFSPKLSEHSDILRMNACIDYI